MKLYYMKQTALDYIKANIGTLYKNYYQFSTPDWIGELFDYDPFAVFAEVPDFELASLQLQPGEIEFENCKIIYEHLKDVISDSQAADERLWAGLCNKTFYGYMRARWAYGNRHLRKSADDSTALLTRYFYRHTGRSGMFRNTLARAWWVGRLTYSNKYTNHWELLNAIGAEDIVSKISDIFYSNTYSANSDIIEGFCLGLKFFRDRGVHVSVREHIRPTAQYLNAVGGGVLLDMFSSEEIQKLVIERISYLRNGGDSGVINDDDDSLYDLSSDQNDITDAEEVNVDYEEFLDSLEPCVELDLDSILGSLDSVEYGCKVHLRKLPAQTTFIASIPMKDDVKLLMHQKLLGLHIGESWSLGKDTYVVIDIRR